MARITMREAISQALWEEMERDPSVFILGEEVGRVGRNLCGDQRFLRSLWGRAGEGYTDCRNRHYWARRLVLR